MKALNCTCLALLVSAALLHALQGAAAATDLPADVTANTNKKEVESSKPIPNLELLEWTTKGLLADYRKNGGQNTKWDSSVEKALRLFAESRATKGANRNEEVRALCDDAIQAGSMDPMIKYLLVRANVPTPIKATKQEADQYSKAADDLEASQYSDIRKFYASMRAAQAVFNAGGTNRATRVQAGEYRKQAFEHLERALNDETIPATEAFDSCDYMMDVVYRFGKEYYYAFTRLDPLIVKKWSNDASMQLARGHFYIKYAWEARGSGYADTVKDEGWKLMEQRLAVAEEALEKAWELNPKDQRIANEMLTVELGQGRGKRRMEMWFKRAMNAWTNNYTAAWAKAYYLEPKWHGSSKELLAFGKECVASTNWGGRVPLVLADAHVMLEKYLPKEKRKEYWKQPGVWDDSKASYEKTLKNCPDDIETRQRYIRRAYENQKWMELSEQLKLLKDPDYSTFGGKQKFDEIVAAAKFHENQK